MRLIASTLLSAILLAPLACPAQSRDDDAVVDLAAVQSPAEAPKRSAFGRVMDVMISALMDQQGQPAQAGTGLPATLQPVARQRTAAARGERPAKARRGEPAIEISLGERFALPPAGVLATSLSDAPE